MRAKTVFSLVALSTAVLFAVEAPDALAKGKGRGRKNKGETVRLATPADGASAIGARGTITIHSVKGGAQDAMLRLRGLDRRTTYEIVNGLTGDLLGTVKTNAKGRATFDLTPGVGGRKARADSTDGTDGTDVPEVVDVVDPETGDTVLTGDTTGTLQGLYGYATLGNATESVTITMGSDPWAESEFFSFSYFAPMDEENWIAPVYEMWVDTSTDELPLGVSSVLDLAGKDFQVRDANGDVVFRGSLPDVEAYDIEALPEMPDDPGIWEGEPYPGDDPSGGRDDWGTDIGGKPFDFGGWSDMGNGFDSFMMGGFFGGGMWGKTGRTDPTTDPTTDPPADPPAEPDYTLWLETADGFVKAGALETPVWEFPEDDWGGGCWDGDWGDDWSGDWDLGWENDWVEDWNWTDEEWITDEGDWAWFEDPATTDENATTGGKRNGRRAGRRNRR